MMIKLSRYALIIVVSVFLLSSCTAQTTNEPTQASSPTVKLSATETTIPTSTQTLTPIPTKTVLPTKTFFPSPTVQPPTKTEPVSDFLLPMPAETPVTEWRGIPINPEALAGEGDNESYYYTVEKTVEEVRQYYEQEMGDYGWEFFAVGESPNGLLLMFQKGTEIATISILILDETTSYIFIVR